MTAIREALDSIVRIDPYGYWSLSERVKVHQAATMAQERQAALEAVAEAARAIHLQYSPENEEALRAARLALTNPDDLERRIPSEERIRIVRDRYLRVEGREPTVREVQEMVDLNPASVAEWLRYLRGETPHPAERRRRARRQEIAA